MHFMFGPIPIGVSIWNNYGTDGIHMHHLHNGRNRHPPSPPAPQVATDTRLWLKGQLGLIRIALQQLIGVASDRAEREVDVLMPGYTHLQPAQTVRWSHWLLSHAAAWQRDDMRLGDLMPRVATLPLGSGEDKNPSSNPGRNPRKQRNPYGRVGDLMPRVATLPLGSGEEETLAKTLDGILAGSLDGNLSQSPTWNVRRDLVL